MPASGVLNPRSSGVLSRVHSPFVLEAGYEWVTSEKSIVLYQLSYGKINLPAGLEPATPTSEAK